ncbi:MAG: ABC1 kinase family protein [Pseudomonadales bacterium]
MKEVKSTSRKSNKVPSGRLSRFAKVAGLAGGLAGGMLAQGARQIRAGESLKTSDLLLTPANAKRVADQLANMRGAAMKLGQILSMDTGDFLPPEWTQVLSRLRSDADPMPIKQLEAQLVDALGDEWQEHFYNFQFQPMAAASIGQVHHALGPAGRPVAIKIQYPGVATSIDSDVDNIASVLRMSGIIPDGFDLNSILGEVKEQLHEEADYRAEAAYLSEYKENLGDDDRFEVPDFYPELSSQSVLCMGFVEGHPIETLEEESQDERNRAMGVMVELMFAELFEWRMVQTDPNFANYLYRPDDGKIVLLDFGATRRFKASFVNQYKSLAKAAIGGNRSRLRSAAIKLGYLDEQQADDDIADMIMDVFMIGAEPLLENAPYDFGHSDLGVRMQEIGMLMQEKMAETDVSWHSPPVDAMYFHRKIAGMFMLATRLNAHVNVRAVINKYI